MGSRSNKELRQALKGWYINRVGRVAYTNGRGVYKLLSGQSRRPKTPERLLAILMEVGEAPDPTKYPELRVLANLKADARWLLDRLVATGMTRRDMWRRVDNLAKKRDIKVKWSTRRMDAILDGTRPFPKHRREPELVKLLVEVLEGSPPGEPDPDQGLGLAMAALLVRARASIYGPGAAPEGHIGRIAQALHDRDLERWKKAAPTASPRAKMRRMVVEKALVLIAKGQRLEELAQDTKEQHALSDLLLGLASPEDHHKLLHGLGERIGQPSLIGEEGDTVSLARQRLIIDASDHA